MSGKVIRGQRLETEIERSREESNWKKVIELAEHLKSRNQPGLETLANFLIGEGKLESYLEENPPTEANISKAKTGLAEARKYLLMCIGEPAKKLEVSLDALLLLSKLEYAMGDYEGALGRLSAAGLDQLTEKSLPTRSLRIVAESYAIKGLCSALQPRNSLCSERIPLPNNSKYQRAEKNEKMIRCFELAGDLTLLYLQEQDKLTSTPSTHSLQSLPTTTTTGSTSPLPPNGLENKKIGVILETALQRAPILYMKAGQLDKAISRYRSMLCAVESSATQHLRLTLARQLAEVLLRGCSEHAYKAPTGKRWCLWHCYKLWHLAEY
ncbi:tetratricopeptide repeat protein 7B-like isoform X1 [Eriocheir sinensis]|uniref:tetratricopeptide repeat protein 7B-like isoform X1 n=1 Tax=Eriocheir sinensis TaxID=95602 RepID=UPI0021C9C02A|nr:tetratricopeptide repeat protein 7B-like isoform X1 [Eriocheir sinensis]